MLAAGVAWLDALAASISETAAGCGCRGVIDSPVLDDSLTCQRKKAQQKEHAMPCKGFCNEQKQVVYVCHVSSLHTWPANRNTEERQHAMPCRGF